MYIIELAHLGKLPILLEIIDVEFHVGRHETGLDRGEIRADYEGPGILVCEFDRPDSGAGADVEDGLGVRDGG
tara:strand:+ start:1333 stop:1551 length:219 start_codon:yes stop_codon:yes gene_type:complete